MSRPEDVGFAGAKRRRMSCMSSSSSSESSSGSAEPAGCCVLMALAWVMSYNWSSHFLRLCRCCDVLCGGCFVFRVVVDGCACSILRRRVLAYSTF